MLWARLLVIVINFNWDLYSTDIFDEFPFPCFSLHFIVKSSESEIPFNYHSIDIWNAFWSIANEKFQIIIISLFIAKLIYWKQHKFSIN